MFQADTKKMMITTAGLLGIRINQNQRKAEIAKKMALAILAYPLQLLRHLPFQEVLKLQQMVHAKDHSVKENQSFIMDCIEQIGLTYNRFDGKKNAYAWSRTRMGGWAVAQSPISGTTINLVRLMKRGYEPMLDQSRLAGQPTRLWAGFRQD